MSNQSAFFDLPLRTELITSACRLRCAWCEHCRERELPPESTERLRARPPLSKAHGYRLKGGETFALDNLDEWTAWARRDGRSMVSLEGPAATLASIALWPEVLNTSLVYEYSGPDAPPTGGGAVEDYRAGHLGA